MSEAPRPEPWLRGPIPGLDPLLAPPIHALLQAREDLEHHTFDLSEEQIWSHPHGLPSLGFHLRHIAGSLDRLTTYLEGGELSADQLAFLGAEQAAGADREELVGGVFAAIDRSTAVIRSLNPERLKDARAVGRRHLPTTVIGLAVHLAEHTQRHVGAAITLCRFLQAG